MSNKLYEENDIQNIANAIRNKNGTEDTYKVSQMSTAIDSIEVIEQATAEGESISLTNTKSMPYKDYVVKGKSTQSGEPSPSNPSEIHSVADDVNLLQNNAISQTINGITFTKNEDGTITANGTANNAIIFYLQTSNNTQTYKDIKAGTYSFSGCENGSYSTYGIQIRLKTTNPSSGLAYFSNYTESILVEIEQNNQMDCYIFIRNNVVLDNVIFKPKLQKGSTATPYSPYNQGTVTIKQRGKNLWTSNLPIIFRDGSSIVQDNNNGGIDMTIASGASLGYIFYDLGLISDFAGKTLTFSISNEANSLYRYCAFINCDENGGNRTELKNFTANNNQITYTVGSTYSQTHLAVRLYIAEGTGGQTYSIDNVQVEENSEKTSYEPYQGNDYTIQTEPLRSLPNGVKDTIEDDGIHRRVGVKIFNEDDNFYLGQTLENVLMFGSDTLDNSKLNVGDNNISMSNFFKILYDYILDEEHFYYTNGGKVYFYINKTELSTQNVAGFKTWLSTHNTEVLYPLAEEIIEPLTQNQANTMLDIIKTGSYEGTTNIYTDEDVKPTIGVGYYKKG